MSNFKISETIALSNNQVYKEEYFFAPIFPDTCPTIRLEDIRNRKFDLIARCINKQHLKKEIFDWKKEGF